MKKIINISTIFILLLSMTTIGAAAKDEGVDDLRGRWDVAWYFEGDEGNPPPPLILFVNDLSPSAYIANRYYAAGCMRSPDSDALTPLSLRADFDPELGSYELVIYSTIVPPDGFEPFVIRLTGQALVFGEGVTDDRASGMIKADFAEGEWSALHHDRRRTKCPSVRDAGLTFEGDVYAHSDLAFEPAHNATLLEAFTVIVSSAMQVVAPDGETFIVQPYTDIFSPDIDFIGRFRYLVSFEGTPISGAAYTFTLLDALGQPIEGTEATDVWYPCPQGAPEDLVVEEQENGDVHLDWSEVLIAPGFNPSLPEPDGPLGFYQIAIYPRFEGSTDYGAIAYSSQHILPWAPFEPPSPGSPDGEDFGFSLDDLEPGSYTVQLSAFGHAVNGFQHECAVYNSNESLIMVKENEALTFSRVGSISGTVYDEGGNKLPNIAVAVDTEEGGFGTCTDENGFYRMTEMPMGTYNVVAGRDFCGPHNYMEAMAVGIELNNEAPNVGGVNFALTPGGSISGVVTDEATGEPLGEIDVVACEWNVENGYCKGARTNEHGSYTIPGLPAGTYFVHVPVQNSWVIEFYDNTNNPELLTTVDVVAGADTGGIDFTLVQGGSISGRVLDEDGNPLANISVDIEQGGFGACTDDDGYYSMAGMPLGTYNVVAGRDFCGPHNYVEAMAVGKELTNEAPNVVGVDFMLSLGGSISGRVTVRASGLPLGGIIVVACEWNVENGYCKGARTNPDGSYTIPGLPEGIYFVHVPIQPEEAPVWMIEFYWVLPDLNPPTPVSVVAGADTPGINFSLVPFVPE